MSTSSSPVPTHLDVVIVPQQVIGFNRVDFAIHARQMRLVVEVDGHEFHEKTKEQAARDKRRDRDLQQEGWSVFHFTGSEVWRDPFGCCLSARDDCPVGQRLNPTPER
jgi:very-short-patch-repair endonuclease